jgi:putative ABC transport system permease protein
MISNYLKIAWRNLLKNKTSTFINIGGLAVGMAVAMLIGLWIWDELSFNKNFKNSDRIAQVLQNSTNNGTVNTVSSIPSPLGDELRKNFGGDFKYVSMASGNGSHVLAQGDKKFSKIGTFFEPQIVDMLSMKMVEGGRDGLNNPSSILLSQSTARAFFGNEDPLNKLMKIDNQLDVKVTGVYEDFPLNSSFAFVNFISPWELYSNSQGLTKRADPWRCNCYYSYTQLADHAKLDQVSAKIRDIKLSKINKSELKQKPALFLFPMSSWHLFSEFKNGMNVGGRIQYVWLFGIIGAFVLLLACINFMNLSTARSEKRAKEVGIRKSVGSSRIQLVVQFFSESLLVVIFAFALSLLLVQIALPFFNQVSDKKMAILWNNPFFWFMGLGFSAITGLIAGSYPAFYLSSFNPVKVLKGTFMAGRFAAIPRRILVVLQFTVSVVLIIGTVVVFRQIQFARNRPIGYNRSGVITMEMATSDIHDHFDLIKNELLKTGAITAITESSGPPTAIWATNSGFDWKGKDPGLGVDFPNTEVTADYGKTVGWQFVDGRDFSKSFPTDSLGFVLNESAVKFMNLKNPVGEIIRWDGKAFKVIGVIRDMIMESPYEPVRPSLFHLSKDAGSVVIAKINPEQSAASAIHEIEGVFKTYNPSQPFDYRFTDEEYARKFGNEERIGKLASFFAILAVFISCLGLFGMASFMAEQRIKEIGVRKVLGASVFNLWRLLSKEFMMLIAIALILAGPLAYYAMNSWLLNYSYRTTMSWWIFAAAAMGAFAITLMTVSFQAIKAAMSNPVKSLRTE